MSLTNQQLARDIVAHLKDQSSEQRWHNNCMGDYLDSPRWVILNYSEDKDADTGEEYNFRTFGLSGASADGRQSGKIIVTTDPGDTRIIDIRPFVPKGKLTASQHDFIALTRGEAMWIMSQAPDPQNHPDFGSW